MVASFASAVGIGLLPEALLVLPAWLVAVLGVVRPRLPPSLYRWLSCIALGGALVAALIVLFGIRLAASGVGLVAYGGGLIIDRFSVLCTVLLILLALLTVLMSGPLTDRLRSRAAAFHALVLLGTAAGALMVAQREMIALFVSLQLFLICMALLVGLAKTNRRSGEAAIKQLIIGAAGSAVLLYGLVILYGLSGSTDLTAVAGAYVRAPVLTTAGIALTLLGLTVALGGAPLHQWVGQAAEGAPAAVAGFVTTMSVVAGLALYLRITVGGFGAGVRAWIDLTAAIAALTMLYAGFLVVRTQSLRRLAGRLVVAQAGFMLAGVLSVSQGADHRAGLVALLLYAMSFGVTALGLFGAIGLLEAAGAGHGEQSHRGLGHRAGAAALLLAVTLAGLGGLPPLAVFIARLLILQSAVDAGYAWLAVVAAVSGILVAAGCVRFIAVMYAGHGEAQRLPMAATPRLARVVVGLCAAAAVAFSGIIQPLLAVSAGGAGTLPFR